MLLEHLDRLGLHHDVAVLPVVVEGGRGNHHPARERGVIGDARRRAGAMVDAARGAARNLELAVPLWLRSPWLPAATGGEKHGDLVLIAILVPGLDTDDVRHRAPVVGSRACHVLRWRRVVGVVGVELSRCRVLVLVRVRGGQVALRVGRARLARPWLDLRPGEHRPADRVVGDADLRAAAGSGGGELVVTDHEVGHYTFVLRVGAHGELVGDVMAVEAHVDGAG